MTNNISQNSNWYSIAHPQDIDSPALLVYPERVKHNILTAINMAGRADRLRPHVKTTKSPDVIRLMQEVGIEKFKCATISEAEMLGMLQPKDVLLAYQPTGPKLQRFITLIKKYPATHFSCLVDNLATAKEQSNSFSNAGLQIPVYIDINAGMNRSGITPGPDVIELIEYLSAERSIKSIGLHVYDGHITNPDRIEREKETQTCYSRIEQLLKEIEQKGFVINNIIAGGSPTFPFHAKRENVECSPGTFAYWDHSYASYYPEMDFLPAVVLLSRVVSKPAENLITIDLGHKSVASENEISRRVFFPEYENLTPVSHSEEHLVLRNDGEKVYSIGDILYGLPFHVCPTVALYERMLTIEKGECTGEWLNRARDRKIAE